MRCTEPGRWDSARLGHRAITLAPPPPPPHLYQVRAAMVAIYRIQLCHNGVVRNECCKSRAVGKELCSAGASHCQSTTTMPTTLGPAQGRDGCQAAASGSISA